MFRTPTTAMRVVAAATLGRGGATSTNVTRRGGVIQVRPGHNQEEVLFDGEQLKDLEK